MHHNCRNPARTHSQALAHQRWLLRSQCRAAHPGTQTVGMQWGAGTACLGRFTAQNTLLMPHQGSALNLLLHLLAAPRRLQHATRWSSSAHLPQGSLQRGRGPPAAAPDQPRDSAPRHTLHCGAVSQTMDRLSPYYARSSCSCKLSTQPCRDGPGMPQTELHKAHSIGLHR